MSSYGYHNPGVDEADTRGWFAFYAPALSSVQRRHINQEATTMDILDSLPAGQYAVCGLFSFISRAVSAIYVC